MARNALAILIMAIGGPCLGSVSTNVPLYHWSYAAAAKLADYGLIDSAMLSTKPVSRMEMARLINAADTEALKRGEKNHVIRALLDRLADEFRYELDRTGSAAGAVGQDFIKPVEDPYLRIVYGKEDFDLENQAGDRFAKGGNGRLGFASRVNLFDNLALYLHPEFEDPSTHDTGIELIEGYGKIQVGPWEIETGKDSLWWGPGYHGAMLMSNNAKNLTMLKVSNPQPIQLPWLLKGLGPFKAVYFLTRLEEGRDDAPDARLSGVRLSIKPHPWIELGGSRTVMFGGEGLPDIGLNDYLQVFWPKNMQGSENQLASLDASVWLPLPRLAQARAVKAYVEWAGEDAAGFSKYVPLVGLQVNDLFRTGRTDLRIEYARTHVGGFPNIFYTHSVYTDGYTYDDRVIGHHMGTDSEDLFLRVAHYLSPDLVLGIDVDRQRANLSASPQPTTSQYGLDLLWFARHNWQLRAAYRFQETVSDGVFLGNNHIFDVSLVYNF